MALQRTLYGVLPDGSPVERCLLSRPGGLTVSCITYGATITSLHFGDDDIVLGYLSLEDYRQDTAAIGRTVGRYANRIGDGTFSLNGKSYDVGCNEADRQVHLHGGKCGFQHKNWTITEEEENAVTLSLFSPDGDMGYPGALSVSVRIALDDPHAVSLSYTARSDSDTLINLTNHTYFNLNGYDGGDVLDTELQINAAYFLPVNQRMLPTGERRPVAETPFDFRESKPIGRDLKLSDKQLSYGGGYDHTFVLGDRMVYRHAASAYSPRSGIRLDCFTDQPGMQLYIANALHTDTGKGGAMRPHQGFCLETQHFPDSPHHPHFPTTVLRAGETFASRTVYQFSRIGINQPNFANTR